MAILWVALYHLPNHTVLPILGYLNDVGFGGVDIFIFMSGFGLAASLSKNSDITEYFGRRMYRLLPSYLPFIIMWMIVRFVTYQIYATEIFGNLTMTGWWNKDANQFNWYIDAIVLFYILAPYIYGIISKAKRPVISIFVITIISFAISLAFMHSELLMAMSRLPLFVLGIGVYVLKDIEWLKGRKSIVVFNVLMLLGFVASYYLLKIQGISDGMEFIDRWHYGLFWYPFYLIAPGLAMDLGFLGFAIKKIKIISIIDVIIEKLGCASFEIFLWHIFIFETAQAKHVEGGLVWAGLFIMSMCLGCVYSLIINKLKVQFSKK